MTMSIVCQLLDFSRERVVYGQMTNDLLTASELPENLKDHQYIRVKQSSFPHFRPTVDGGSLSSDLLEILRETGQTSKILVDLRHLEQLDSKGFNSLRMVLGMLSEGEIALTGVSNRIKIQLDDLQLVKTETNLTGFRIVTLPSGGNIAKEK